MISRSATASPTLARSTRAPSERDFAFKSDSAAKSDICELSCLAHWMPNLWESSRSNLFLRSFAAVSGGASAPGPGAYGGASSACSLQRGRMDRNFDWKAWRRQTRERLIAERLTRSAAEREDIARRVCAKLDLFAGLSPGQIVSFYWPSKGELDLRKWILGLHERGIRSALPVVTVKH